MAGAQILSSIEAQRKFAGNTRATTGNAPPPPVQTTAEFLNTSFIRSELESLTSGGIHPESIPVLRPVARFLDGDTGNPGPNGGTTPALNHPTSPGPSGSSVATRGHQLWADLKARLGA